MRTFVSLFVTFAACELMAFDSADWRGKRELFAREAERLTSAYSNCVARLKEPAENVTIPVETYPDGSVKTLVRADKAQYFFQEGLVWGEGVEVRRLGTNGVVEARIEAKSCVVDRNSRSGWAEGAAKVTQGKTVFSGRGVYFSAADSYVRVFENTSVESDDLKLDRKMDSQKAKITARTADFDNTAGLVRFEGEVAARSSSGFFLGADEVFLFLQGTNELNRLVAIGGVSLTNENRFGTCAMATYRRRKGEIEMFGDGRGVLAHLEETGTAARALDGTRIKFWVDSDQAEVDNARITAEKTGDEKLL